MSAAAMPDSQPTAEPICRFVSGIDPARVFIVVNLKRISLAGLLALDPKTIKTVDARGCTALTQLKADAAEYVDASGCTALTELKADAAEYVYASGCTALTELKADAAEYVDASGCTALTEPPHFDAGSDKRGYQFSAIFLRGQWRIIAGCRNFSLADARRHWGPDGPSDRPDCLALIEKLAAQIAERAEAA